jgi:hypothetical protein
VKYWHSSDCGSSMHGFSQPEDAAAAGMVRNWVPMIHGAMAVIARPQPVENANELVFTLITPIVKVLLRAVGLRAGVRFSFDWKQCLAPPPRWAAAVRVRPMRAERGCASRTAGRAKR